MTGVTAYASGGFGNVCAIDGMELFSHVCTPVLINAVGAYVLSGEHFHEDCKRFAGLFKDKIQAFIDLLNPWKDSWKDRDLDLFPVREGPELTLDLEADYLAEVSIKGAWHFLDGKRLFQDADLTSNGNDRYIYNLQNGTLTSTNPRVKDLLTRTQSAIEKWYPDQKVTISRTFVADSRTIETSEYDYHFDGSKEKSQLAILTLPGSEYIMKANDVWITKSGREVSLIATEQEAFSWVKKITQFVSRIFSKESVEPKEINIWVKDVLSGEKLLINESDLLEPKCMGHRTTAFIPGLVLKGQRESAFGFDGYQKQINRAIFMSNNDFLVNHKTAKTFKSYYTKLDKMSTYLPHGKSILIDASRVAHSRPIDAAQVSYGNCGERYQDYKRYLMGVNYQLS